MAFFVANNDEYRALQALYKTKRLNFEISVIQKNLKSITLCFSHVIPDFLKSKFV